MKEIASSRALQIYGGLLSLTHLLSAFFWHSRFLDLVVRSSVATSSLCWPFFPSCETLHFSSLSSAGLFLEFYAIMALVTAGLFFFQKVSWGYYGLLFLFILKIYFTSLSYGLMGNYHYMSFFVQAAFLFLPHKTTIIPFFIGIFYWGAGLLKFNPEWLSGTALIIPSFLPPILERISLAYAVILECILVFGLFSQNRWIRYGVFAQFILFHLFSWHIVGYFYPMTMFLLLSLFILVPLYKESWNADFSSETLKRKAIVASCLFVAALQVIPYFFAADPAASGAPRILSLNMLDARMQCETLLIRHTEDGDEVYNPFITAPSVRVQCDPLVFLSQIKTLCKDPSERMDFWLQSRRSTEDHLTTRLHLKDVCKKSLPQLLWAEIL